MSDDYTAAVQEFMLAFGQDVRTAPTVDITEEERLLRAHLVLEEALEFVYAMGFKGTVVIGSDRDDKPRYDVHLYDGTGRIDLVEAADALADLKVVVFGSDVTLGLPAKAIFDEVHRSNMSKLGADGKPILREGDNKVLKGPDYAPPNIGRVLETRSGVF